MDGYQPVATSPGAVSSATSRQQTIANRDLLRWHRAA